MRIAVGYGTSLLGIAYRRWRIGDVDVTLCATLSHRFGSVAAAGREPGIALGVEAGVVGIEVDEACPFGKPA